MNLFNITKINLIIFFISLLLYSRYSYAYLDPGTGTLIIQSIIAGIVGLLATIGIYWVKFKLILKKLYLYIFKKNKKIDK